MPKQSAIEQEGVIVETLPNAMFKVELENGHVILAHISGKMRMHYIKISGTNKINASLKNYENESQSIHKETQRGLQDRKA